MAEAGKAATAVHQDSGNAEAGQAAGGLAASSASSWATHPCSAVSCAIIALLPCGLPRWRSRQALPFCVGLGHGCFPLLVTQMRRREGQGRKRYA
jgi:hypothetical protein